MISYGPPTSKSDTKNRPSSFAVLVFVVPVGTCFTVTSAPETFTTPLIEEVVPTSANDDVENISTILSEYFEDEVRRPTQAEWKAGESMISLPCGWTELLADEATGNHRGAPLDGRPREGEMIGPMSGHRVSQSAHPTRKGVYAQVATPGDRPLPKVGFRLVVSRKREGDVPRVPDKNPAK